MSETNFTNLNIEDPKQSQTQTGDLEVTRGLETSRRKKKLSTEEKRELIRRQLTSNFPTKTLFFFSIVFFIIGLSGIGLQIALICYKAIGYEIGNGIWGGSFAIFNGLIKLNLFMKKYYRPYVMLLILTPIAAIMTSVGMTAISSSILKRYPCPSPACNPRNQVILSVMLFLGFSALACNILFLVIFNIVLYGNCRKCKAQKLGFFEACKEAKYLFSS